MPKQPKLVAIGTLHYVMGRGIERTKIFRKDMDQEDSLSPLGNLCREGFLLAYSEELTELQKYL